MGLDVHLYIVHRRGTSNRRWLYEEIASVLDGDGVLLRLFDRVWDGGKVPMLDRFTPWSDLTVTSADAPQFVQELKVVSAAAQSGDELARVDQVRELAYRCMRDKDLELHILGD